MGSLAEFAEGSSQFAINSGSTLVDFGTGLPSLVLMLLDAVGFGTSVDLTASVE
ncbi:MULTISPECIES: hypothetical protein [Dietzia]|uniref:SAM-dependent methyltransferase n=1 Tax=Dietzia maris TaxID=37915 RepID=A0ABT8GXG6_9ACTN|nr:MULTISPECIES: hypothetical protein [Dietzia]MCY1655854.1 hypothetical protein [Dietzia sp. SL131]MDN4504903.1 hypothetical protein [Dietzia maris]